MELKKYDFAIKIFRKAISINPKYYPSYNNLGRCYEINNDYNSALIKLQKSIKS